MRICILKRASCLATRSPIQRSEHPKPSLLLSPFSRQASSSGSTKHPLPKLFLHVGPAGECWTGTSLFAAKHLQPDYVRSIPLPDGVSVDRIVELVEGDVRLGHQIYDEGRIPVGLLENVDPEQ